MADSSDSPHEPALRGPWPMWALAAAVLASFVLQSWLIGDVDVAAERFGLIPAELARAHWIPLVTSIFIHGGWAHVGFNTLGILAFGGPVARLLGLRGPGPLYFLLFFLTCGVLGGLGYVVISPHSPQAVIGASGAVSGLFGAASRLLEHRPRLSPFASRTVVTCAAAWVVANLVFGLTGLTPGLGPVQVAWQVHLIGYGAGLVLIGPWTRLPGVPAADQAPVSGPEQPD